MKRFISWIVMFLGYVVVYCWGIFTWALIKWILGLIDKLPLFFEIVCYIIVGTTILGVLLAPILYGPHIVIMASEAIKASKKGNRYKTFAVFMLILAGSDFFRSIFLDNMNFTNLFICAFSIGLLIASRDTAEYHTYQ